MYKQLLGKLAVGVGALTVAVMLPTVAYAQTICNGVLTGSHTNDIFVLGGACTLDGVTTTGSVLVTSNGTLNAINNTQINGGLLASGAGNIDLNSVTVLGGVMLNDSQNVTVGAAADLSVLNLTESGTINAAGSIDHIFSSRSGAINLTGATIPAGVSVSQGNGGLTICVGTVITGGVNLIETTGGLAVGVGAGCGVSTINGAVTVEKGTGDVQLIGALTDSADLNVIEQTGNVVINNAKLSDLKVEKLTGSVTLTVVETDSDTTLAAITGPVAITSSTLGSDVNINTNSAVTLTGNDFTLEDLFISGGAGAVTLSKNVNLSFSISERNGVTISGNTFGYASVTKNTGGVSIVNNTGETLTCVDNNPAPTGSGNTITVLADGQCAGF